MRILSGIQPSGKLHLGNYFGAVRQFIELQNRADEALYFIADLHALTTVRDGLTLRENSFELAVAYLAFGLDPNRAILFRQSEVPEIPTLSWILSSVTPVGLLERGHSYKDKIAKGIPADTGLFTYPVLMAADILLYGTDAVPVGQDQKQHLEFARDIATKFNLTYVPGYDAQQPNGSEATPRGILKLPEAIIQEQTAVIPGIDGQKMSKSYDNTIDLFAPDKVVKKRFMSIKTDSTPVEAPKPEPSTVLSLLGLLCDEDEAAEHRRTWREGGVGYGTYKKRLVSRFHELFDAARGRREELLADRTYVEGVLKEGAERARAIAWPLWEQVREATGISSDFRHADLCGKPIVA